MTDHGDSSIATSGARQQLTDAIVRRPVVDEHVLPVPVCLTTYRVDARLEMFRLAATYVDKILKGAKPADLPVEQATKFELILNMRIAKTLGLTIPRSIVGRADQVIQ